MRFILTACIWIVIVGGLWAYTQQRQQLAADITPVKPKSARQEQHLDLLFTPTFTTKEDPFALQVTDEEQTAFEVRVNGNRLDVAVDNLERGVVLPVNDVEGFIVGQNEIYIQASPPLEESGRSHGVRIQLNRGATTVIDRTVWAAEGALVAGTVHFVLTAQGDTEEGHDH